MNNNKENIDEVSIQLNTFLEPKKIIYERGFYKCQRRILRNYYKKVQNQKIQEIIIQEKNKKIIPFEP